MANPLVMWNSCGLYTVLPYGYNYQRVDALEERMGQVERKGNDVYYYDDDEYYEEYYDEYYDEYQYPSRAFEKIDNPIVNPEFNESSILESIFEIILSNKSKENNRNEKPIPRAGNRQRLRPRYPPTIRPQEKTVTVPTDGEGGIGNMLASVGFFTVVLPVVLGGLLYLGVPVAQSLFAGASLITTFLLTGNNKSLVTPVSIDSVARVVLINILEFLDSLSQGREGRISESFPFCMNSTYLELKLAENGCKGDFLQDILPGGAGIINNITQCREGSLPNIVHKIGQAMVTVMGDCVVQQNNTIGGLLGAE